MRQSGRMSTKENQQVRPKRVVEAGGSTDVFTERETAQTLNIHSVRILYNKTEPWVAVCVYHKE